MHILMPAFSKLLGAAACLSSAVCAAEPDFVLRYFGVRGLAEPARLLLNDVGADYEEVRYARPPLAEGMVDWGVAKEQGIKDGLFPFGQVPSLTHNGPEGATNLVQSKAIVNYLGRQYGLYGSSNADAGKIDVVIGGVEDLKQKWRTAFPWGAKKDVVVAALPKYLSDDLPVWLAHLETLRSNNGGSPWMTGSSFTIADIFAFECFDANLRADPTALDAFPGLQAFVQAFVNRPGIKKYLKGEGKTVRIPFANGPDTEDSPGAGSNYLATLFSEPEL